MSDSPQDTNDRIDGELFAGRKIQAIKLYREATHVGLREAKDAVDAREAALRVASPERFAARGKGGCMTMVALAVVLTTIGIILR